MPTAPRWFTSWPRSLLEQCSQKQPARNLKIQSLPLSGGFSWAIKEIGHSRAQHGASRRVFGARFSSSHFILFAHPYLEQGSTIRTTEEALCPPTPTPTTNARTHTAVKPEHSIARGLKAQLHPLVQTREKQAQGLQPYGATHSGDILEKFLEPVFPTLK